MLLYGGSPSGSPGGGLGVLVEVLVEVQGVTEEVWNCDFELLNQLTDTGHYDKKMNVDITNNANVENNWSYSQFISHSQLSHDQLPTHITSRMLLCTSEYQLK